MLSAGWRGEVTAYHYDMSRLLVFSLLLLTVSPVMAEESTWKHDYAEVNGVRLHYVSAGEGPLILFIHGFPEFWYEWKEQLKEFSTDHQAVAFDMRGYNLSSKPESLDEYQMPKFIGDIAGLIKHLGKQKAVIVAHDWGGAIAWAFASVHPELTEKLVIINAPHPTIFGRELRENPEQQAASSYMNLFRSADAERALSENNYENLVRGVLGELLAKGHFTEADKKAYIEAWSRPGALTGGLNYYRAAGLGPNPAGPAPAPMHVKTPTLVIWGEKDRAILTSSLKGLEEYVSDLTIKRIPDGSHWVIHEKPALINTYIREFLKK